jgi:uncharacterized protein
MTVYMLCGIRGFGDSVGVPSEKGTIEDVSAILAYVESLKISKSVNVFLYGESLGTGVAVAYLNAYPKMMHPTGIVRGLILLAPFTSLPAAALSHPIAAPFRIFSIMKEYM